MSLTGDPESCRGLARSIVTELAARADGTMAIEIVGDPLAIDLDGRGLPGVRHAGSGEIDPARAARLVDELEACRWPHTFAARASGRRAHAWVPFVWVTDGIDHPQLREMVDTVAAPTRGEQRGRSSWARTPAAGLRIELDADGGFAIPDLGLTGQAQQIDAPTVDQAADLLARCRAPPGRPDPRLPRHGRPRPCGRSAGPRGADSRSPRAVPSDAVRRRGDDYHDPDFDVLVRVCGDIHVEGGTERLANLETAVAVYVALHGETTVERIRDAVWNGTAVSHKRVRNVISNARSTLGDAIRWVDEGRIAAGDGLLTDLELVRRRLAYAARQTTPQAKATTLHGALEWVAGRVCTSPATNGWTWIDLENWIPQAESLVGTAACDLARLCLELGDPEAACWAASQGIAATGPRDHLAVLLARGYEQAGDAPAARATLDQLPELRRRARRRRALRRPARAARSPCTRGAPARRELTSHGRPVRHVGIQRRERARQHADHLGRHRLPGRRSARARASYTTCCCPASDASTPATSPLAVDVWSWTPSDGSRPSTRRRCACAAPPG